jgi:hypothetical protein
MAYLLSVKSLPSLYSKDDHDAAETKSTISTISSYANYHSQADLCPRESKETEKYQDVEKSTVIDELKDKRDVGWRQYGGIILTLIASLCFSLSVLFVKVLKGYGFDAYGASFWRYTGVTIPIIPVLMYYECGSGKSHEKNENGNKKSVFDTVWPVFENGNWRTWIGLLVRRDYLA